jgi:hypothetical protein
LSYDVFRPRIHIENEVYNLIQFIDGFIFYDDNCVLVSAFESGKTINLRKYV